MLLRIIMTNTTHVPTREEIQTVDREIGQQYLEDFGVEWAGYIVLEDTLKLSAQWLLETFTRDEIVEHVLAHQIPGYNFSVYEVDEEAESEIKLV